MIASKTETVLPRLLLAKLGISRVFFTLPADWLSHSSVPKLFGNADPGSILAGAQREFCRTWPNQTEVTVKGLHFIQEDSGAEIGRAVAAWSSTLQ